MGKGSHGPNCIGSNHSHDNEYPEDTWNLYSHIDKNLTRAFNIQKTPNSVLGIFKPNIKKLIETPNIVSDCDEEILINIEFLSPVFIKKICVIGGDNVKYHPKGLKCYPNKLIENFDELTNIKPGLELNLLCNKGGLLEFSTNLKFQYITKLTLYFYSNHGDIETTIIKYIGFQGEHTHDKRNAVETNYELIGVDRFNKIKNEKLNIV